jgi:hypothetical protein
VHWVMCRIISEKAASFLHSKLWCGTMDCLA